VSEAPETEVYEDLKVLFIKLCNPRRFKLMEFFYEISTESLKIGIGGSKRERSSPAGVGGENFTVSPLLATYTPANTWDTANANPIKDLDSMMTKLQKKNVNGPYVVLAGIQAYQALLKYLEEKGNIFIANYTKIDEQAKVPYIEYYGFRIYKVAETYTDVNGTTKYVIDPKSIVMVGELPFKLRFLSLDDMEYGMVAMPMLVKVVKDPYGKSLTLLAESKPFPIPKVNAIIKAKVLP